MFIRNKCKFHDSAGFSLTELSIVIVIIALLVSAVLKGQSLVEEAKIQAVVSEVAALQVALNSFSAKYSDRLTKLPGDFDDAVNNWGGTTANGDNNGQIEFKNTAGTPVYEGFRLWQHLSYAKMVDVPYLGTATTSAATPGADVPASKVGGGYMFDYSTSSTAYDAATAGAYGFLQKNIMILGVPLATSASPIQSGRVMTPFQAMGVDAKMDDNVPTTGRVRGSDGVGATAGNCVTGAIYNINLTGRDCILIFKAG